MIAALALTVVVLTAVYFVALGSAALFAPQGAARFLLGFAASAPRHYAELALRLVVGAALVVQAPRLLFADAFVLVGWGLLATTAGLLLVPWRWHRRFAADAVPRALRHLPLLGAASLALGALLITAVVAGRG